MHPSEFSNNCVIEIEKSVSRNTEHTHENCAKNPGQANPVHAAIHFALASRQVVQGVSWFLNIQQFFHVIEFFLQFVHRFRNIVVILVIA